MAEIPVRIAIGAGVSTRVGSRRANNEDAHYLDPEGRVFVVADGIGGAAAGERASQMAVDLLAHDVGAVATQVGDSEEEVFDVIRTAFADTSRAIRRAARQNIQYHRMGTTAVMAFVTGPRLFIASVGDSRAYLVRANQMQQLTVDHTVAQALVEAGTMSRNEALKHPWRNVLCKFLGSEQADNAADLRVVPLQEGDQIVLATDGLTDVVDDPTMLHILQENSNAQDAATALIQAAGQEDARDDATCIVLFARELDAPACTEWRYDSGRRIGLAKTNYRRAECAHAT
jgi:protein phosphatase